MPSGETGCLDRLVDHQRQRQPDARQQHEAEAEDEAGRRWAFHEAQQSCQVILASAEYPEPIHELISAQ